MQCVCNKAAYSPILKHVRGVITSFAFIPFTYSIIISALKGSTKYKNGDLMPAIFALESIFASWTVLCLRILSSNVLCRYFLETRIFEMAFLSYQLVR